MAVARRKREIVALERTDIQAPPFVCDVANQGDRAIVSLRGDLDLAAAPVLRRELLAVLAETITHLTVDLGHLTFMDSSGLHALLVAASRADERGIHLRVISVPPQARRVIVVSGRAGALGLERDPGGSWA